MTCIRCHTSRTAWVGEKGTRGVLAVSADEEVGSESEEASLPTAAALPSSTCPTIEKQQTMLWIRCSMTLRASMSAAEYVYSDLELLSLVRINAHGNAFRSNSTNRRLSAAYFLTQWK